MNSVELFKYKNDPRCMFLEDDTISKIVSFFSKSNIKQMKGPVKQINIMKTNKIQAKKDMIENKLIMIMNKISENNMNELLIEYITSIFIDEEKYNIIQTELYNKMIKDIKFIDYYVKFSIMIFITEYKRNNFLPNTFINIIKNNINNDDENIRIACYNIIKNLIRNKFFNSNIINYISNIIFNTNNPEHYIDTFHLFNEMDVTNYKDNIINMINKCNELNMHREKILIESLIENKNIAPKPIINQIKNDDFSISVTNILDEYIFLNSIDEVKEFILSECNEIDEKNIFCCEVYKYYINNNNILALLENLVKNKILFKSNLSKGLLLFINENNISENIIRDILKFLKKNNITKNIENIFKKYKVKLFYEE